MIKFREQNGKTSSIVKTKDPLVQLLEERMGNDIKIYYLYTNIEGSNLESIVCDVNCICLFISRLFVWCICVIVERLNIDKNAYGTGIRRKDFQFNYDPNPSSRFAAVPQEGLPHAIQSRILSRGLHILRVRKI